MATSNRSDSILDELPIAEGVRYGAAAWGVGFVIVTLLVNLIELDEGFEDGWLEFGGFIFYNAHYVDVAGSGMSINYLHDDIAQLFDWTIPAIGYTILVAAIVAVAGYMLATRVDVPDGVTGAKAGASIVAGYLPLALVGSFAFEDGGASPELGTSLILMGVLFPVVLGAVGGYIAGEA